MIFTKAKTESGVKAYHIDEHPDLLIVATELKGQDNTRKSWHIYSKETKKLVYDAWSKHRPPKTREDAVYDYLLVGAKTSERD